MQPGLETGRTAIFLPHEINYSDSFWARVEDESSVRKGKLKFLPSLQG